MAEENKQKEHESMGHKLTHPFHHHKDGESQQSGDAKTAQDGKEHPEHKKEGLVHRMEDYAKKENVKEDSDNIWGHGPHVG